MCVQADGAVAQDPVPSDTYWDSATRELVQRAVSARLREVSGIRSYEATLRQRMYVGITALRFRRERALFEHERIARIRWSDTGEQAIQWIGVRTAAPIAGIDTSDPERARGSASVAGGDVSVEVGRRAADADVDDLAAEYLDETEFPGFDFDPSSDRLRFGDDWAFHPLADTSLVHYRYSPGDTLRLRLPANDLAVVLYEVRVAPRRADFELVAGSLWLDSASASLVRATYRPARPWNMRVDQPEDADDVPGFIGPIEGEIHYITVESSLQELEFWLPRRFAFQGEARAGGLFRIPMTLEWSVGGYVVNEPPSNILVEGELPPGWQREVTTETDDDGVETTYTIVVPTSRELRESTALSDDFGRRSPVGFSQEELDGLTSDLQELVPTYRRFRPRLAWGLEQGQLRYNRVEGLSVGTSTSVPLGSNVYFDASARIGTGDRVPNLAGGLRWGPETNEWTAEGYHRLASMNDRDNPFGLPSSAMNFALGGDRGEYFRSTGAAIEYRRRGSSLRTDLRGFVERQQPVDRTTDFSLRGVLREDTVSQVLQADDIDVVGGRAGLSWFVGTDPSGWVFTGGLAGEAGFGDAQYQKADARLSVSHPLLLGLAGAVEVGAGTSWGTLPVQRSFFLGSSATLRGFHSNEYLGASFWRARGELATDVAAARVSAFSDLGWVGPRASFRLDDPLASVGLGISLLDGLVRLDVARAVRGADRWKAHLYLDGLF